MRAGCVAAAAGDADADATASEGVPAAAARSPRPCGAAPQLLQRPLSASPLRPSHIPLQAYDAEKTVSYLCMIFWLAEHKPSTHLSSKSSYRSYHMGTASRPDGSAYVASGRGSSKSSADTGHTCRAGPAAGCACRDGGGARGRHIAGSASLGYTVGGADMRSGSLSAAGGCSWRSSYSVRTATRSPVGASVHRMLGRVGRRARWWYKM